MNALTQEYLKSILHYDPDTGLFTRLVVKNPTYKIGSVAGTVDDKGYIRIGIDNKYYRAHRLAFFYMTGEWPKEEVDHENLDKTDNRWINLRDSTKQQNKYNRRATVKNKLGVKGVCLKGHKYIAQIQNNKKVIHLGSFDSISDAKTAYDNAASELFGKFYHS